MDIPDTHKTFSSVSILSPSSEPEPSSWGGGTMRQWEQRCYEVRRTVKLWCPWCHTLPAVLVAMLQSRYWGSRHGSDVHWCYTILTWITWTSCLDAWEIFRGGHHLSIMISDWEHLYLLFYKPSNLQHYQILSNIAWMSGGERQDTDRRNHWDREHGQ